MSAALLLFAVRPIVNVYCGMYRRIWRHASVPELLQVSTAVTAGSLLAAGLFAFVLAPLNVPGTQGFSRSFWVIEGLVSLALLGGVRYAIGRPPKTGGRRRQEAPLVECRPFSVGLVERGSWLRVRRAIPGPVCGRSDFSMTTIDSTGRR